MDCSMPDFPVLHYLPELAQTHVHWVSVMPSNHLILCCPLLLLPSVFPSIRVFYNESVLHIKWPKYWRFSLSISPSSEYSVLISFMIDWLISLQSKGLSRVFSNTIVRKHQFFSAVLKLKLHTLATWSEELTHYKRLWCWERAKAGGEGDDRGWDGWMASLTH